MCQVVCSFSILQENTLIHEVLFSKGELAKYLSMTKYKSAVIQRLFCRSHQYLISYNSKSVSSPIRALSIFKSSTLHIVNLNSYKERKVKLSVPQKLKDFVGRLPDTTVFYIHDISVDYASRGNERKKESLGKKNQMLRIPLSEFLRDDFIKAYSDFTAHFVDERKKGNFNPKLVGASYSSDVVEAQFFLKATSATSTTIVSPDGNSTKKSDGYLSTVQFLGLPSLKLNPAELDACDIRLHCNCPAFHFQGNKYQLTQLDSAIHKTDIKDSHWSTIHKSKNGICKHLEEVLRNLPDHYNTILAMVN